MSKFSKVSKRGRKFLFAGKGMSVRTGRFLGESMLVGAVTGLVVVAFKCMIDFAHRHFAEIESRREMVWSDPARWILFVLPAAGALLGYLLIKRFSKLEHARGTDSAIMSFHKREGYITSTVIPIKPVASVLTVGSGGSAGYEGPVTLLGAACGSAVARTMKIAPRGRRILMAAGLAAGIAALFQAPLAGAIFGFEIFYSSSDIEDETVLPCFIAAAVSYAVYACLIGQSAREPLFVLDNQYAFSNGLRLLPYFALAVAVAFGVRFYISFFRFTEKLFERITVPGWAKVVIGGLVTGGIGFFCPDILSTSYSVIEAVFSMQEGITLEGLGSLTAYGLFALFILKTVATSFTVGSGGSGGLFAPALVCGAALGAAVGIIFKSILPNAIGVHPQAFALVGMAGFMASALRIPLTAIVMVAEMSGNHQLLLPAMWVCGISFWLNSGWTLYRSQVHAQESSPVHG
jgi:CIC family chloride channel protein